METEYKFAKEQELMKGNLVRVFCAMIVIILVISVVLTDKDVQKLIAQDGRMNAEAQQDKKNAVVEADHRTRVREQTLKKLQRQMEAEEEKEREKATYALQLVDDNRNLFLNKVDGYTIQIPRNMKADMSFSNIRALLGNENLSIEIYRQEFDKTSGSGIESYINYSNLFLNNQIDHRKELEGKININGRVISFLQWSRRPLARIENDKCHYASIEVPIGKQEVMTILFKSNKKYENKNYLDIVRSLKIIEKTEEPYVQKIHQVENLSWDEKTARVYEEFFGENSKLNWGIFETHAPVDFTELEKIEREVHFVFPILLYYTGMMENEERHPRLAIALENAKKEGRLLELTLQTVEQTQGKGNMVYEVLDGKYDTFLKNYAGTVANSEEPVLFRLGNEMNGDWCVYSSHHTSKDTEIFKAFYRYIYRIFQEAEADNVIWVWNPNGKSFPDFKWNEELCYYPGDEYVDVIGMTSYNTGTYYEGETWAEFEQMYDPLYKKYIERYEKPLMITEFSSSSVGGNKEAWVANMFQQITKYDRIKAAVWWDGCDWDAQGNVARPYFIDETEELIRLFQENLARFQ